MPVILSKKTAQDPPQNSRQITVLASFSGEGGVERMLLNLLNAWLNLDIEVDLLRIKNKGPFAAKIPNEIHAIDLPSRHAWGNVPALVRYIRRNPDRPILAVKERAAEAALASRWLARSNNRIVIRLGTHLSTALRNKSFVRRGLRFGLAKMFYPLADQIVAISQGVADDVASYARVPKGRIRIIHNPVLWPGIDRAARKPTPHSWLQEKKIPVLVAAGRLTPQKDFATLIRALARIREIKDVRLIILGEGPQRPMLEDLIQQLGLHEAIDLPGFADNPYSYMARADVFVLSSAWEGFGNVLVEAMSLGVPVVSTDCPSGPGEIIRQGSIAPLANVGDPEDLAYSIGHVLENPPSSEKLQSAAAPYDATESSKWYIKSLFPY